MRHLLALILGLLAVDAALAQRDSISVVARAYNELERRGLQVGKAEFYEACVQEDVTVMRLMYETASIRTEAVISGITVLQGAAHHGKLVCVSFLLDIGANPNADPAEMGSPLRLAAAQGHLAVVRRLIAAGASLNHAGSDPAQMDLQPLSVAVVGGHRDVVMALLDAGATPGLALTVAVERANYDMIRILAARAPASQMSWAYRLACNRGMEEVTALLQSRGVTETCVKPRG